MSYGLGRNSKNMADYPSVKTRLCKWLFAIRREWRGWRGEFIQDFHFICGLFLLQNDKEEKKQEKVRKDSKEEISKKEEKQQQTAANNHMNGMTTAPTSIPQIKTEDVSNETIPVDAPPPTSLKKHALAGGPALARRDRRQSSSLFLVSTNRE
ncbi:unnamed protein product, partial [Onchocerca flexuosa]|uniref:DUF5641 domain-containing protein n=1 Tax=Onchocerca flexuosa TaxID=387005 RepID=A0A183H6F8_9BILA